MDTNRSTKRGTIPLLIITLLMAAACSGSASESQDGADEALDGGGVTAGEETADTEPIVIGGILDRTGAAGPYGTAAMRGAEIAIQHANDQGGVGGRPLEFQPEDGGFDVGQSTALLQRFAGNDDVLAIIGPNSDSVTIPLTDAINNAQIVAVQTSGAEFRPNEEYGEWLFSIPVRNDVLIETVISELADRSSDRVAVVYSNSRPFAVAAKDDFVDLANEGGLEVVGDPIAYADEDVNFSTIITTIQSLDSVDAVFCSCLPESAGPMIAQAAESGLDVQWVSDASLLSPDFYELSQQEADGTLAATPFDPNRQSELVQSFVQDFEAAHDDAPDVYAAYGHDAALSVIEAIKTIDGELTREAIREAMAGVSFQGVTGTISFPDGQGASTREEVFVVEMQDGEFVAPEAGS